MFADLCMHLREIKPYTCAAACVRKQEANALTK